MGFAFTEHTLKLETTLKIYIFISLVALLSCNLKSFNNTDTGYSTMNDQRRAGLM